ncbi:cbb3-type cytochrome oxidase assembly protein CcoS [Pseudoxanthomonas broegbernensis]|uniref:Cbb3-type cytochrome oxidase assembly protein CcoS n=1 Tax=Pseudoxanthomonas broegbernensis TaxID=83619 RepID=A0A7V8GNF3_9GAMM|nr:cbb3-type cytochrome oxidase assembly protein CcoS [Pseudoxanthomonas broegbernensis]MBB6065901.1 cbb3-type cytochrome oxidase maturation protein [Pseudoxanthomonas broegbernensis]
MNILLLLIPISLLLLGAAVGAFVWAVRRGQFDDLDTPALDILDEHDRPAPPLASSAPVASDNFPAAPASPEPVLPDPTPPDPTPSGSAPPDPALPDPTASAREPRPPRGG